MGNLHPYFVSLLCTDAFAQLLFFPVAGYAFWKGNCKWVQTPVKIYVTHAVMVMAACPAQILFATFSSAQAPGPRTLPALHTPFLVIPLLVLSFVLFHPAYHQAEKMKRK